MNEFECFIFTPQGTLQESHLVSFVGRDATGSFGIRPKRFSFTTILEYGITKMKNSKGDQIYYAIAGGALEFRKEKLTIVTSYAVKSAEIEGLADELEAYITAERTRSDKIKLSIKKLDEEILKRLHKMGIGI